MVEPGNIRIALSVFVERLNLRIVYVHAFLHACYGHVCLDRY